MKSRVAGIVLLSLVVLAQLTVFQNCSEIRYFGNGGGYEGGKTDSSIGEKPEHTYYSFSPACPDGGPRSAVVVTEGQYEVGVLIRKDCAEVAGQPEVAIRASGERPIPLVIVYGDAIHERDTPLTRQAMAEHYCEYQGPTGEVQLIIRRSTATGRLTGRTSFFGHGGNVSVEHELESGTGLMTLQFRALGMNNNEFYDFNIDVVLATGLLNYNMPISLPDGSMGQDPLYGVDLGDTYTNTLSPFRCFNAGEPSLNGDTGTPGSLQ